MTHRVYESVDDKSLSWDISQKSTENRTHVAKSQEIIILKQGIVY